MVSHYKQATLLDCGMACVKTIISYYFPKLEHLDSLQFDNNNHQGLSLFEIEGMLKSYGIDADSYQIDTPSLLNNVSFPYLMVVERAGLPHYIVVLDRDSNLLTVSDPANEEIEKISSLELFSQSVGIVLIPQKSESVNLEDRKGVVTLSYADKLFIDMCSDIIENGYSTEGEKVRPKWPDGTYAYTIKKFGVVNRYDLSKEFPAITLRKTYIRSAIDEILWIWQKKSNNVHDLSSHIWDEWADEDGSIGKAYGYQLGKKHKYKEGEMDQVDRVLFDLKENPFSRRIMTNIYVHEDLHEMNLYPCAYSMTFNVTGNRLNAILNQRSQDILAANNWNVVQYAALLMMFAQVSGFEPGELVHVIADAHIYDRHIPIVKELIQRPVYPAPKVTLNPEVKDFYKFTVDDFTIEDYEAGPQIKNIPIAI